jgi:hypothetical protein
MKKRSLIPRKPSIQTPAINSKENFEETKAQPLVKPRTTKIETNNHTAPHMVQQNNQQQKHFRTLKSSPKR